MRWMLANWFNPFHPSLPLGTLAANLAGGYLVGIAVAVFAGMPQLSPQARLFVITGFLGGLTTFSTFSAEAAAGPHRLGAGDGAGAHARLVRAHGARDRHRGVGTKLTARVKKIP